MSDQNQIQKTLLEELGLADLPQEKQEALLIKMTEVILKRMFVETMDKLKEEDQNEYNNMLERGAAPEEIEEFLKSKISDYDQLLEKVLVDFKREMGNNSEETKQI